MPPFVHVKFGSGRPPEYCHHIPFAHELDPLSGQSPLPEGLKTDVQREGILRYLRNNFKEGSYVWEVVHEREKESMYCLCLNSWHRSVGDNKLHLSLYIYQEDRHVATWHAYADRSVSYSREGGEDEPAPEAGANDDPYSTPKAMAAAAASRPSSPFVPPETSSERPRFDRPAAEPTSSDDEREWEEGNLLIPPGGPMSSRRSDDPSSEKKTDRPAQPKKDDWDAPPPENEAGEVDDWIKPPAAQGKREDDDPPTPKKTSVDPDRPKRSSRARKLDPSEEDGDDDLQKPAYPLIKSKPIAPPVSSRHSRKQREPEPESPSPIPKPTRHRQDHSASPARSSSPPPARSSRREEPASPVEPRQTRGRSSRASRSRPPSSSRSPSPPPKSRSSRSKPASPSRAPSPEPQPRSSRHKQTRQASPASDRSPSPPRHRSRAKQAIKEEQERIKQVVEKVRERSRSRSASRSPSPPPKPRSSRSQRLPLHDVEDDVKAKVRSRHRSLSRSPSPPTAAPSSSRRRSSPPRSTKPPKSPLMEEPSRSSRRHRSLSPSSGASSPAPDGRGRSPPRPSAPPAPQLERTPSWRSVSRNRHRRDDSDEDTLVRGNLDDHELDIPAGGEVTLLQAKQRTASQEGSARTPRVPKDEGFDPSDVAKPPEPTRAEKPTAKAVLGNWFKSVGAMLGTETKLAAGEVEQRVLEAEVDEEEARARRKEERRHRREKRAARRAAREKEGKEREAAQTAAEEEADELQARTDAAAVRAKERSRRVKKEDSPVESDENLGNRRSRAIDPAPSTRSRSQRRQPKPSSSDDEPARNAPPVRSQQQVPPKEDPERTRSTRHRHRHHGSSNVESPAELEDPPPRPGMRQRAMSISASVDAGLKGLRNSVAHLVSNAVTLEKEKEEVEAETRQIEKERREILGERRKIREKGDLRRSVAPDSEEEQERQMLERAKQGSHTRSARDDDTAGELARSSRRRTRRSRAHSPTSDSEASEDPPPRSRSTPRRQQSSDEESPSDVVPSRQSDPRSHQAPRRQPAAFSDSEASEAPPPRSRPPPRRGQSSDDDSVPDVPPPRQPPPHPSPPSRAHAPVFSDIETSDAPLSRSSRRTKPLQPPADDSDASLPPLQPRQQRRPPPSSVSSDTDTTDAPSRASRSSRESIRSESEGDTEAHLLAKRNARRNSTTIPAETIRKLREEQVARGIRSVPASPASTRTHRLPEPVKDEYSSHKVLKELEQAAARLEASERREKERIKERLRDRPHLGRSNRRDSSASESSDDSRFDKNKLRDLPSPKQPPRSSQGHPVLPGHAFSVASSPLSPQTYPSYSYSTNAPPIRPQPIKPSSFQTPPAPLPQRFGRGVPIPSSAGSSDEAEPSRPASSNYRERRGYRTGDSGSDAPPHSGKNHADSSSTPPSSYRFPPTFDSDSDGGALSGYTNSRQPDLRRFERSPTRSPSPPPVRRAQSFSRSQPSFPFSGDEDDSEPAPPSSSYSRRAPANITSSRPSPQQPHPSFPYSDDDDDDAGAGPESISSSVLSGSSAESNSFRPSPSSGAQSRYSYPHDDNDSAHPDASYNTTSAIVPARKLVGGGGGRTIVGPPGGGAARRLVVSSSSPPPRDVFEREGLSGFTGFDLLRGPERERERVRERERTARRQPEQQGVQQSGSARQYYGDFRARVSRRTAKRLGM
ncbi:hypothetical protein JCM1840_006061 [Sporobolomyces johnsonii]